MPGYTIILHWMFPKGQIVDRRGTITQHADPKPHTIILLRNEQSDLDAIDVARDLWKKYFVGKQKKVTILGDGNKTVFEHAEIYSSEKE